MKQRQRDCYAANAIIALNSEALVLFLRR